MAKRKTVTRKTSPKNRQGYLPGEHRRRSVVPVERVRASGETRRPTDADAMMTIDTYILTSRRISGDWTYVMELNGNQTVIPAKVLERFISQREAILAEERKDRARDRASLRVQAQLEEIDMSGI